MSKRKEGVAYLNDYLRAICSVNPQTGKPNMVLGTGYEFVSGLVLTAGHVVEEYLKLYEGMTYDSMGEKRMRTIPDRTALRTGSYNSKWLLACVGISGGDQRIVVQNVLGTSGHDNTELATLLVGPQFDYQTRQARSFCFQPMAMDLRPPSLQLPVWSVGFPRGQVDLETGHTTITERRECGRVVAISPNIDGGTLGFPQATVEMHSEPGMSGAPVFDMPGGRLMGVVSRSWGGEPCSTVALLWPLAVSRLASGKSLREHHQESEFEIIDLNRVKQDGVIAEYRPSGDIPLYAE